MSKSERRPIKIMRDDTTPTGFTGLDVEDDKVMNKINAEYNFDTWDVMKKVAKDEARKTGNYKELRELRKIEKKNKRNKTPLNVEPTVPVQFDLKFFTKNFTDNKPVERPKILDQKDPDPMLEKGLGSLLGMSIKDYK